MKLLAEELDKREPTATPVKQDTEGQKDKEANEDCVMKTETSIDLSKTTEIQEDCRWKVNRALVFACLILPFFIVSIIMGILLSKVVNA